MVDIGVKRVFTPEKVCSKYLNLCSNIEYKKNNISEYIEKLLSDKPKEIIHNDFVN